MRKKFISILLFVVIICSFCGCQYNKDKAEKAESYPRDFLCGYFLTFEDKNDGTFTSPSSDDFTSDNAVAKYAAREYTDNADHLYVKEGLCVTYEQVTIQGEPLDLDKSGYISMSETIHFTAELIGKTVNIYGIYYNATSRELYSLLDTSAILSNSESVIYTLSDEMFGEASNSDGQIEIVKYDFHCNLTIECWDKLTDITITEVNSEHKFLKTTEIDTVKSLEKDTEEYIVTESECCEIYLTIDYIIQKYYEGFDDLGFGTTTSASWALKSDLDEDEFEDYFYFPYGNGLTKPLKLKITFPKIS